MNSGVKALSLGRSCRASTKSLKVPPCIVFFCECRNLSTCRIHVHDLCRNVSTYFEGLTNASTCLCFFGRRVAAMCRHGFLLLGNVSAWIWVVGQCVSMDLCCWAMCQHGFWVLRNVSTDFCLVELRIKMCWVVEHRGNLACALLPTLMTGWR